MADRSNTRPEPEETDAESFAWDLDALIEKANRLEGPVALLLAASLAAMRERYTSVVGRLEHAEDQVLALDRSVRTMKLEVVDGQGRVRATLDGGEGDCFGLRLFDIHGTEVMWLNVHDVEGEPGEEIEGQGGFFLARGGEVVSSLAVDDDGVSLALMGGTGGGGFEWEVADDGRSTATLNQPRPDPREIQLGQIEARVDQLEEVLEEAARLLKGAQGGLSGQ